MKLAVVATRISQSKVAPMTGYRRLGEDNNANVWLIVPLVNNLVEARKVLAQGRCYSFVIPPTLNGLYTVENTVTLQVAEHYEVDASIHNQIKDLPDGALVMLRANAYQRHAPDRE